MIQDICKWLPKIIKLEDYNGDWKKYNQKLYELFENDFIKNKLYYKNKLVQIRINPREKGYEHAFIHLTCKEINNPKDLNDRIPDLRRCERISWNRKIIENNKCYNNCSNCQKILYYEEYYKNNVRINLVFIDVRFKVILEKRKNYFLLITGYYLEYNHNIEKEKRKIKLYRQQKTPLE